MCIKELSWDFVFSFLHPMYSYIRFLLFLFDYALLLKNYRGILYFHFYNFSLAFCQIVKWNNISFPSFIYQLIFTCNVCNITS